MRFTKSQVIELQSDIEDKMDFFLRSLIHYQDCYPGLLEQSVQDFEHIMQIIRATLVSCIRDSYGVKLPKRTLNDWKDR